MHCVLLFRSRVLILTTLAVFALPTYGQSSTGESRVTLNLKNTPLKKVFSEITRQTKLYFLGNSDKLDQNERYTIKAENETVNTVLTQLLGSKGFIWTITDNTVLIQKSRENVPLRKVGASNVVGDTDSLITVIGKVVDEKGDPIPGATVLIKGSQLGTTTGSDGTFKLVGVKPNAAVVITNVAYLTKEFLLRGKGNVSTIQLEEYVGILDEAQIIAYGVTSRRLNTGNVSTIKASDIAKSPVSNPLLAIQGRVPGVFIEQSSGLPGSGVKVKIQGINSITKGNDPLYVIDGVPYVSQLLPTLNGILGSSGGAFNVAGSPLSFINPSDIESIDVLKDADATSIYGSRAASGAILITTKKGQQGDTRIDMNIQTGWAEVTRKLNVLNTTQYIEMRKEAIANDGTTPRSSEFDVNGVWDQKRYTNWQKELIGGTAQYKNVGTTISGGSATTTFLIGANYRKETTVFPGDLSDQRGSVHFNVNNSSKNKRFKVLLTGNYLYDNNCLQGTDLTNFAITLPPNAPALHNSDGTLNWEPLISDGSSTWTNPLTYMKNKYINKTNNLTSNATVSYQVISGLDIKSSFGFTSMRSDEVITTPNSIYPPELRPYDFAKGQASFANGDINSWTIEPQITYQHSAGLSQFNILLGSTIYVLNSSRKMFFAEGYNSDLVLEDIKAAARITTDAAGTLASKYKYGALFGRLNYSWKSRYIANITFRRDGSSRFGIQNRYHNFASASGAWIFSDEPVFSKLSPLSFGKLRVSFGTTGNDQIGDYAFLSLYDVISGERPYQGVNGLKPKNLPSEYLQWEETSKLQAGLDFGFFKDRIFINTNYFHNRSSNQLLNYSLPTITGQNGVLINFPATVQNTGWEFIVNSTNIKTNSFAWNSSVNLTIPRNKLVAFPNLATSTLASNLIINQPIDVRKVYKYAGVDPITGLYQVIDKNGKITSKPDNDDDKVVLINPNPKFYGGFQNSFSYKGFELDLLFQFVKQLGENRYFGNRPGQNFNNQPLTVVDRWQKSGDIKPIQRYSTYAGSASSNGNSFSVANQSDKAFSDASYLRLKNVSLSWRLPIEFQRKVKLQNARLYVQGQNLWTNTKYPGLDPENRSTLSLPPLRVFTFGINVTF
jgi:TonB-linked SusC/RagA family outer membrane protein